MDGAAAVAELPVDRELESGSAGKQLQQDVLEIGSLPALGDDLVAALVEAVEREDGVETIGSYVVDVEKRHGVAPGFSW